MGTVIKVENLSKRYLLGARAPRNNLREVAVDVAATLLRRLRFAPAVEEAPTEFWALKNVSFDVEEHEIVGIVGRNGAGKSTLLKVISKIVEPTRGMVKIRGRVASLLEVGTGFHPELTGMENIFLSGVIMGMARNEIRKKLDEIVAFADIDRFLDTPVKRYSSGMYVRLAFAVAAHLDMEILLVDEVLAVGDSMFQKKCLGKMQEATRSGRTVILVSHHMETLANLCRRVLLLEEGRLVRYGPSEEVIDFYLRRNAEIPAAGLRDVLDREGEGRLKFTECWIEDAKGNRISNLRSGQSCKFVLRYETTPGVTVSGLYAAVLISTDHGVSAINFNNNVTGDDFDFKLPERGQMECLIPRFPLNCGSFTYGVYARSQGIIQDWVKKAGTFDVEAGDYFHTGKLPHKEWMFLADHNWRFVDRPR